MNIFFLFCLLLAGTFAPLPQHQKADFLDLTKPKPEDKAKTSSAVGIVGGGSGTRTVDLPLRVRVLKSQQMGKYLGEKIFYEVSIENIGGADLRIPWTAEYQQCSKLLDQRGMSLILVIQDTVAGGTWIAFSGIYGCANDPNTLRVLHPGEHVRVRAGGVASVMNESERGRLGPLSPRKFTVKAELFYSYSFEKGVRFRPALSENSFIVELKKRQ